MDKLEKTSSGIKLFGATISAIVDSQESKNTDGEEKRPEKIIQCPRCKSMETKFCYFNNYNVNQPRHFCKGCQRYWTAGGALRNVPVGAGRRKMKPPPPTSHAEGGYLFDQSGFQFDYLKAVQELQTAEHGGWGSFFPAKRRRFVLVSNSGEEKNC